VLPAKAKTKVRTFDFPAGRRLMKKRRKRGE
jgi:hypothetical protein